MKIEVGKFYKQRDGDVVKVKEIIEDQDIIHVETVSDGYSYSSYIDGKFLGPDGGENIWDLVSQCDDKGNDLGTAIDNIEPSMEAIAGGPPKEEIKDLTFGQAISLLKSGARVTRTGWNGKDMYLELQVPDEHSKMQQPYIYMSPVDGKLVPWLASQTDMLSEDWMVYNG